MAPSATQRRKLAIAALEKNIKLAPHEKQANREARHLTPEEHVAKLRELAAAGVDQFNVYLMNGDEEAQLELYGRHIIPALRDVGGAG